METHLQLGLPQCTFKEWTGKRVWALVSAHEKEEF